MQDRFKFRAWDKIKKIMYYPVSLEDFFKFREAIIFDFFGDSWELVDSTALLISSKDEHSVLMQCTGLKDKNGKLIYEGDVLKAKWCFTLKIVYQNACFGHIKMNNSDKSFLSFNEQPKLSLMLNTYEIIGNIYENPELLEV
jgi:uncharacterized phage protein (TIGR01671 family)